MNICGISKFLPNTEPCPTTATWEVNLLGSLVAGRYQVCDQHLTGLRYSLIGKGHSISIGRSHG